MSLTYRWEVTGLRVRNQVNAAGEELTDAIVQTYWKQYGVDADGNEAFFTGATPFTAVDVPAGQFVAFADLTEATVLGWIQDYVVSQPGYQEHIDEQILRMIDTAINVERDVSMPWAPESVTPPLPADAQEVSDGTYETAPVVLDGPAEEVDPGTP